MPKYIIDYAIYRHKEVEAENESEARLQFILDHCSDDQDDDYEIIYTTLKEHRF